MASFPPSEEPKGEKTTVVAIAHSDYTSDAEFDTVVPPPPSGILARLRHVEAVLDKKLGVEQNGPARILPEDRRPPNQMVMALMWASGTMNLSCFATGFLGFEFGLDLKQSILTVIFGTLLGSMVTVSRPQESRILIAAEIADNLLWLRDGAQLSVLEQVSVKSQSHGIALGGGHLKSSPPSMSSNN